MNEQKQNYDPYAQPPVQQPQPKKKLPKRWLFIVIPVFSLVLLFISIYISVVSDRKALSRPTYSPITETTTMRTTKKTTAKAQDNEPTETARSIEELHDLMFHEIDYDDAVRNPETYTGELIQVIGEVTQYVPSQEIGQSSFFVVYGSLGDIWMILMEQPKQDRIREGDRIKFNGNYIGLEKVLVADGTRKEVPTIEGWYFYTQPPAG